MTADEYSSQDNYSKDGNPFMDGCSATPAARGIDGAQVNQDSGRLKPCADRKRRACLGTDPSHVAALVAALRPC